MIWLGLLWVGIGSVDAVHTAQAATRRRWLPTIVGVAVVLTAGGLSGRATLPDAFLTLGVAVVVAGWGPVVRRGFGAAIPAFPLAYGALATLLAIGVNPAGEEGGGLMGDWLAASNIDYLQGLDADRCVLVAGALMLQGSTGNVLVRLVLLLTHTIRPAQSEADEPGPSLKGGRLLGPMERWIILGLGMASAYTAVGSWWRRRDCCVFPSCRQRGRTTRDRRSPRSPNTSWSGTSSRGASLSPPSLSWSDEGSGADQPVTPPETSPR